MKVETVLPDLPVVEAKANEVRGGSTKPEETNPALRPPPPKLPTDPPPPLTSLRG